MSNWTFRIGISLFMFCPGISKLNLVRSQNMGKTNFIRKVLFTGRFHQHFTCAFFVWKCFTQLSLVTFQLCNFWRQNIGSKCARKMLMKLTPTLNIAIERWGNNNGETILHIYYHLSLPSLKMNHNLRGHKKYTVK